MVKRKENTCWEYWRCPKKTRDSCVVYQIGSGADCWDLRDVKKVDCPATVKFRVKTCLDCPFFKKMNPGFDEKVKASMKIHVF